MISLTVPGTPIPLARSRTNAGRHYLPRRSLTYREDVRKYWRMAGSPSFGAELLTLSARFYRSDRRRLDLDNLLKGLLDALKGCLYEDDSQIVRFSDVSLHRDPDERTEIKAWRALEKAA